MNPKLLHNINPVTKRKKVATCGRTQNGTIKASDPTKPKMPITFDPIPSRIDNHGPRTVAKGTSNVQLSGHVNVSKPVVITKTISENNNTFCFAPNGFTVADNFHGETGDSYGLLASHIRCPLVERRQRFRHLAATQAFYTRLRRSYHRNIHRSQRPLYQAKAHRFIP